MSRTNTKKIILSLLVLSLVVILLTLSAPTIVAKIAEILGTYTCSDSDSGKNPYTQGLTELFRNEVKKRTMQDVCIHANEEETVSCTNCKVKEYFCQDEKTISWQYYETEICIEGAMPGCMEESDCDEEFLCNDGVGACKKIEEPEPEPEPTEGTYITSITINEFEGIDRQNEPFTFGIPFAKGEGIFTTETIFLTDAQGSLLPAQFKVTSRWGGTPADSSKPIRWVLADMQTSVQKNTQKEIKVFKGSAEVPESNLIVEENSAENMRISTGAAQFTLNKQRMTLFDSIVIDGQELIEQSSENGIVIEDITGKLHYASQNQLNSIQIEEQGPKKIVVKIDGTFTSNFKDEYCYQYIGNQDGLTYMDICDDANPTFTIPNWLTNSQEDQVNEIEYTLRMMFYENSNHVVTEFTLRNMERCMHDGGVVMRCNIMGSLNNVGFKRVALQFKTTDDGTITYTIPTDVQTLTGSATEVALYQDSYVPPNYPENWNYFAREDAFCYIVNNEVVCLENLEPRFPSYVTFRGFDVLADGNNVATGDNAQGEFIFTNEESDYTIGVGIENFPENFPMQVGYDNGMISLELFPKRYAIPQYGLRAGEQKTHRIILGFGKSSQENQILTQIKSFNNPLLPQASEAYYDKTDVFGAFPSYYGTEDQHFGAYETENKATVDITVSQELLNIPEDATSFLDMRDNVYFFGKLHEYGAWMQDFEFDIGHLEFKYDITDGALMQTIRTDDPRWLEVTRSGTYNLADFNILHCNREIYYDAQMWYCGSAYGHVFHDRLNLQDNYRGNGNPSVGLEFGEKGLLNYYYMTGYMPAYETAIELANNTYERLMNDDVFNRGTGDGQFYEYGAYNANLTKWEEGDKRTFGNGFRILTHAYLATGDERYKEGLATMVNDLKARRTLVEGGYLPGNTDPDGQDIAQDDVTFISWQLGDLLMGFGEYLDMMQDIGKTSDQAYTDGKKEFLDRIDYSKDQILIYTWPENYNETYGAPLNNENLSSMPYYYPHNVNLPEDNLDLVFSAFTIFYADAFAHAYEVTEEKAYLQLSYQILNNAQWYSLSWDYPTGAYSSTKEAVLMAPHGMVAMKEIDDHLLTEE